MTPILGLHVPATTPREAVAVLSTAVREAVESFDVREKLAAQAVVPGSSTPEELGKILAAEIAQWAQVIKAAGIRVD